MEAAKLQSRFLSTDGQIKGQVMRHHSPYDGLVYQNYLKTVRKLTWETFNVFLPQKYLPDN